MTHPDPSKEPALKTAQGTDADPGRAIVDGRGEFRNPAHAMDAAIVDSLRPFMDACVKFHDALVEAYPRLVAAQAQNFAGLLRQAREDRERP